MPKAIDLENGLPAIKTWVEGKFQEKETGKGLSTNDYTTAEKNKLAGIDSGAEVNVQADWSVTDSDSDAYIKNKPTIDTALSSTSTNAVQNKVINTALGGKVDKVTGKGLSTNDYTTEEKSKLAAIAAGAEVNVNADWNADSGDAQILNKPSIPSATSDLTNDSGFITSADVPTASTTSPKMDGTAAVGTEVKWARGDHVHPSDSTKVDKVTGKGLSTNDYTTAEKNKLAGIAAGAEVNVNADWEATEGDAQILNKPSIPAATSDLTNDSGFITAADVPVAAAAAPQMDGTAAVGTSAKYARENHVHPTDTSRAPTSHASTATTYGAGNGTNYGHVKLSDATDGTSAASGGTAATPKAVSDALAAAKSYADGKVTGLYSYKGSVATYANLPASPSTGDVYNVEAAYNDHPPGTNWAWTGTAWDALGGSFTITYATAAEVTAVLEA